MSKHDHSVCDHDMRYCKPCDTAYCKKCDREWPARNYWYSGGYYYTSPTIAPVTCDSITLSGGGALGTSAIGYLTTTPGGSAKHNSH